MTALVRRAARALGGATARQRTACAALLSGLVMSLAVPAAPAALGAMDVLTQGRALRASGDLLQSIELLQSAVESSSPVTPAFQSAARAELGESLMAAGRLDEAEPLLQGALVGATPVDRARFQLLLGNLAVKRKQDTVALERFNAVLADTLATADLKLAARLNRVRLFPQEQRWEQVAALHRAFVAPGTAPVAGAYRLHLGQLASGFGASGLEVAYTQLEASRAWAVAHRDVHLQLEALDALAQLYEDQKRSADALQLTQQALALAAPLDAGHAADLLISLEWRQARLLAAQGLKEPATAAYQRAIALVDAAKQDIPIEYEDGQSSYERTFKPLYLGYVDLLLKGVTPQNQSQQLRAVVDAIEASRQAELQDFLGDRCSVEAVQGTAAVELSPGTAVLYPVVFADHVALIVQTAQGYSLSGSAVKGEDVRIAVGILAEGLRYGIDSYKEPSRQLYDWLVRPIAGQLALQNIHNLVVVPDGALRLVPFSVLHDGARYLIEQYAVSSVTGMSMTNQSAPLTRDVSALVAGVSLPGDVIDKLDDAMEALIAQPSPTQMASHGLAFSGEVRAIRALLPAEPLVPGASRSANRGAELRSQLSLPGVKEEVSALSKILQGKVLLDQQFTAHAFKDQAETGAYRIVHVASHGIFGGSADTSFLLAYDELLTMGNLQTLLKSDPFQKRPIELLSLSACETAEGNARAPLGISGAAIKARAKSVMGTLWPVNDLAAKGMMVKTYEGIARQGLSKTDALQKAQVAMLQSTDMAHPFYWGPFVLIGNWK